jgi:sarcosine oxidase
VDIVGTEVVVVGLGAFGSAALWRLARRGIDVVGIERHGIGHELGSSHGLTRLFRIACMEHPGLAAIARMSLRLWTELGDETGQVLVRQTGCLNTGAPASRPVTGALAAAAAAGVPVDELGHEELVARQPQYAGLAPDDVAVWDPGGGICYPERNVRAHVSAAQRLGATVHPHTTVDTVEAGRDEVVVRTATLELHARQVIVAAGAWLGTLLPGLPLTPRKTPLTWFRPRDPASTDFTLARFPAFIWHRAGGESLWGHGSDEDYGIKIGVVRPGDTMADDVDEIAAVVARALPGLDPQPAWVVPCMITDSPDGQFLAGRLGPRLVVAGGDSGHGFKHAAGIGELLAQITLDEPTYTPTGFLDPTRFRRSGSGH